MQQAAAAEFGLYCELANAPVTGTMAQELAAAQSGAGGGASDHGYRAGGAGGGASAGAGGGVGERQRQLSYSQMDAALRQMHGEHCMRRLAPSQPHSRSRPHLPCFTLTLTSKPTFTLTPAL